MDIFWTIFEKPYLLDILKHFSSTKVDQNVFLLKWICTFIAFMHTQLNVEKFLMNSSLTKSKRANKQKNKRGDMSAKSLPT